MTEIKPFQGVLYNKKQIKDIAKVATPPYDVISDAERERFYNLDPCNIVRLILPESHPSDNEENNKYTRAADVFRKWLQNGILKVDEAPSLYPYRQEYVSDGKEKTRTGFIALLKLEELGTDSVYGHEATHSAPKEDRIRLTKTVGANLSCVFFLYKGAGEAKAILAPFLKEKPFFDFEHSDNIRNKLWKVQDKKAISSLTRMMEDKKIVIADGHHRYESALYLKSINPENAYVMVDLVDLDSEDMAVFPTHRLLKSVREGVDPLAMAQDSFEMQAGKNAEDILLSMKTRPGRNFGMYWNGRFYLLTPKDAAEDSESLGVDIIHNKLIEPLLAGLNREEVLEYTRSPEHAVEEVDRGNHKIAFFLQPEEAGRVIDVALAGRRVPQKTTYFYPKLTTGLVMYKFSP